MEQTGDELHELLCRITERLRPIRDLLEDALQNAPEDRALVEKLNSAILDAMEARGIRAREVEKAE